MQSQHPGNPLILIAESDQQVRNLQQYFLEKAGLNVEFTHDGESALERARISLPALVVTEILISKLDGLSLCRRLRDDPLTRGIPVLVFSILAAEPRASMTGPSFVGRTSKSKIAVGR